MKVNDIVNRLKDTRGYLNEQIDYEANNHLDEDELNTFDFMLDGVESAILFFEEWLLDNEDNKDYT